MFINSIRVVPVPGALDGIAVRLFSARTDRDSEEESKQT